MEWMGANTLSLSPWRAQVAGEDQSWSPDVPSRGLSREQRDEVKQKHIKLRAERCIFFFPPLYGFHEQHSHIRSGSLNTPHILHRACNAAMKSSAVMKQVTTVSLQAIPWGGYRDPGFQQGTWQQDLQLLFVPLCLLLSQTSPFLHILSPQWGNPALLLWD